MEIDITIRNATPEEAQRVLIGMSFAEDILGKLSPAIRIEKAQKKQVPDPTCDEETGCAGCDNTGAMDADRCDKCSPPPAHKPADGLPSKTGRRKGNKFGIPTELAKTDKKLFDRLWQRCKSHGITYEEAVKLKPTKRGRKPKAPNASKLTQAIDSSNEWTLEEDAAIRECPNEDMALTHFMNKFPESERTAVEVSQRWQELRGLADEMAEAEA
ncbi:MAG: hypothetical protein M0Q92_02605 [Methanoregula sp.]|jgi:hypothetical protein|nr:hypothetical protein [Methanoregula sp.]